MADAWVPLDDVVTWLKSLPHPMRPGGSVDLKYVNVRVDTRDLHCCVTNQEDEPVSFAAPPKEQT